MFSLLNDSEMWLDIEGYEGLYSVSNMGRVFSHITNKILKGSPNDVGYLDIALHKNKKRKTFRIHNLVGNAFVGKREGGLTHDHIDRNNQNNCADNLRLATRSQQNVNRVIDINNTTGEKNISISRNRYSLCIKRNCKILFRKNYLMKKYSLAYVVKERNEILKKL